MIVVDTSALIAILKGELESDACIAALTGEPLVLISAGTMAEALVVAQGRGVRGEMEALLEQFGCEVVATTGATAGKVADAYSRWGKGVHPASLNFGDCFAYALARERGCPLLFVGDDFSRTDIVSALPKT